MSAATQPTKVPDAATARLVSIRMRLLIVTSTVILMFVSILIALDYRREIRHHFDEKHADLVDEARTVLTALLHLQNHGSDAVQDYVDSICSRMDADNSPDHHIAVRFGVDSFLQTDSNTPLSADQFDLIVNNQPTKSSAVQSNKDDVLTAVYMLNNELRMRGWRRFRAHDWKGRSSSYVFNY